MKERKCRGNVIIYEVSLTDRIRIIDSGSHVKGIKILPLDPPEDMYEDINNSGRGEVRGMQGHKRVALRSSTSLGAKRKYVRIFFLKNSLYSA